MPIVDLDVERQYKELIGSPVVSGKLQGYAISVMLEKIKFKIDEVGAKVENQAVITLKKMAMMPSKEVPKRLILDKPFWVVMRQKGKHPYFITHINNESYMMKNTV